MSISLSFRISQKTKTYNFQKKKKTSNIGKYKPNENQSPNNDYRRLFLK